MSMDRASMKLSLTQRMLLSVAPKFALRRQLARYQFEVAVRNFEGATKGRRTEGWKRTGADVNATAAPYLALLRNGARDLCRNNPYARRGRDSIVNNMIAWGITQSFSNKQLQASYTKWAESFACDFDGRHNLWGLQAIACTTMVESGEALVIRKRTKTFPVPFQIQVLEPDYIDTTKNGEIAGGGYVMQGIEFDKDNRVVAYWLFDAHPGSAVPWQGKRFTSRRMPAEDVIHVFRTERPGQVRGVSWFAPVMIRLRDYDTFEDARLMTARIAACFAAFVKNAPALTSPLVGQKSTNPEQPLTDKIEPALIQYLASDQEVEFANPPLFSGHSEMSSTYLHGIATGLGISYEELTGDLRGVNYSSGRMGRQSFMRNLDAWRWQTFIPLFCEGVAQWFIEAAKLRGQVTRDITVRHSPPPLEPVDPIKEADGNTRLVRAGFIAHDEIVRQYGYNPEEHYRRIAENNQRLDDLGIILDSDPRRVNAAGAKQAAGSSSGGNGGGGEGAGGEGGDAPGATEEESTE